MFFQDLRFGPSTRTVKLRHEARAILELHFVHAVLEGIERVTQRIAGESYFFDSFEHLVRCEREEQIGRHADVEHERITGCGGVSIRVAARRRAE